MDGEETKIIAGLEAHEARLLCSLLEEEGIPYQPLDENMNTLFGSVIVTAGARLMVRARDHGRVLALLNDLQKGDGEPAS